MANNNNSKIGGIPAALLAIIIGIGLLWFNEGNNVKNIKAIAEARKNVIQVSSQTIDSANEGALIATSGKLNILSDELQDDIFEVTQKTAKLVRNVEMYQWEENEDTDSDGNTTYSYSKEWSNNIIDSSNFHSPSHVNPQVMPYESKTLLATGVDVGAFSLTLEQIERLDTPEVYSNLSNEIAENLKLKIEQNYFTTAANLATPEIGDIRISFKYNNDSEVSLLGKQYENKIVDYVTQSGKGKTFNVIVSGIKTGEAMINDIEASNNMLKWVLRAIGILLIIMGIAGVLSPISRLTSRVPILGNIVGAAVGGISFLLGLAIGLLVIAIAWIRFRPLLGIGLIVVVVLLIIGVFKLKKNKTPKENTTEVNTDTNNF